MKKLNKKGFTIVELVIVIAVIAVLTAVLIPVFSGIIDKAYESADVQATRDMNLFLTTADITGDVDSILDVYEVFEESGFDIEDYTALRDDRTFFYDVQLKKVLYVEDGEVVFPEELKGTTKPADHDWLSMSMTVDFSDNDMPADLEFDNGKRIKATVQTAQQYAFVIEEYNNAKAGTELLLTIDGTIDLLGTNIAISKAKGPITITGTSNATLKNITSNKFASTSNNNSSQIDANYISAAIVGESEYNVTISNITFENVNIKSPDAGNVAFLCGRLGNAATLTISEVAIKNSTVIGGRSVAALVGAAGGSSSVDHHLRIKHTADVEKGEYDLLLKNVKVYTTQGRSALLITTNTGKAAYIEDNANIVIEDSSLLVYEDARFEQVKKSSGESHKIVDIDGNDAKDFALYALKTLGGTEYSCYAHKDNALILEYSGTNTRTAYMDIAEYPGYPSNND